MLHCLYQIYVYLDYLLFVLKKLEISYPSSRLIAHSYFVGGHGSPETSQLARIVEGSVWKSLLTPNNISYNSKSQEKHYLS